MKKSITIAVLMALVVASSSIASETAWRFFAGGASSDGTAFKGKVAQLGVGLLSIHPFSIAEDVPGNQIHGAAAGISGSELYDKQTQSNCTVNSPTTWTAYVAANSSYPSRSNGNKMMITVSISNTPFAVPSTVTGVGEVQYIVSLDGIQEAVLDASTFTYSTATWSILVWSKVVDTRYGGTDWAANGYKVEITQKVVSQPNGFVTPEPSSLLALGGGLIGLVGIAVRRRRA